MTDGDNHGKRLMDRNREPKAKTVDGSDHLLPTSEVADAWVELSVASVTLCVCVFACPCSKRKKNRAIYTQLGRHTVKYAKSHVVLIQRMDAAMTTATTTTKLLQWCCRSGS